MREAGRYRHSPCAAPLPPAARGPADGRRRRRARSLGLGREFRVAALASMLTALALAPGSAQAASKCSLAEVADFAITMVGLRPMIATKMNGHDAQLIADSGAFYSMLTASAAADYKLRLYPAPFGFFVTGAGGSTNVNLTKVDDFVLANTLLHHIEFIVGGTEMGSGAAGILGQNVLRLADAEYDLANGAIRLMRPTDCHGLPLAYWVHGGAFNEIEIERTEPRKPHTIGHAYINGKEVRVLFDTGAPTSVLSLRAAERAGVKVDMPDVVDAGLTMGIGRKPVQNWIAPFRSFKIGDEEIQNTHLRIGDFGIDEADMLLGADFFLSHRIYVATSQHKLYFTYNGGPVFNLVLGQGRPHDAAPAGAAAEAPGGAGPEPTDAAGYARRGAALTSRHEYQRALADLTRACELNPTEASYFLQRGQAHWGNHELLPAIADFDRALLLKPGDVATLMTRARARFAGGDRPGAIQDLGAADQASTPDSNFRLELGQLYVQLNQYSQGIADFDLWIESHRQDGTMHEALNSRCWARALAGVDLDKALADCNEALKRAPGSAAELDSRGTVLLRLGRLDKAIEDFNAALALRPKVAWSLYGRGVAHLRRGETEAGQADIAAASAIQPKIEEIARNAGIVP
jgi:tetratricopeptide (TPR) repeat protein/predicted aspartyl protease